MFGIVTQIKTVIQYRQLLWALAIKDIEIRYRTPALGFLWALLIPLVTVLIFKLIFSTIMKIEIENYPFFIYMMTAVFPWNYFSSSISSATESIVNNRELIKKTYFPRQIIPISIVLANLINFIPVVVVMLLILLCFKISFTMSILLLPVIIVFQTMFTIGLALILSAFQVFLRDIKYIMELTLMAWFYLSPGFYSLTLIENISESFLKLYSLNPFVGLFTLYRIALLNGYEKTLPATINIFSLAAWTIMVCIITFLLGLLVFKKYELNFSDTI
jgi:ABC-2 type transport system permease protein